MPTDLTTAYPGRLRLGYLEIANGSGSPVDVTVYDMDGLVVIPKQSVQTLLTYRSDYGTPLNGLAWVASAPGCIGWFCEVYTPT